MQVRCSGTIRQTLYGTFLTQVSRTYLTHWTCFSQISGTQTRLQTLIGGHWTWTCRHLPGTYTQRQLSGSSVQQPGSWTHLVITGPGFSQTWVSQRPVLHWIVLV